MFREIERSGRVLVKPMPKLPNLHRPPRAPTPHEREVAQIIVEGRPARARQTREYALQHQRDVLVRIQAEARAERAQQQAEESARARAADEFVAER